MKKQISVLGIIAAITIVLLITILTNKKSLVTTSVARNSSKLTVNDYEMLASSLDPKNPGKGKDILGQPDEEKDRPMAYGLILSALAHHHQATGSDQYLTQMKNCGNWLLNNSDIDGDGIHGFGLSDAWDAFGDKTINPAHQEYTITTAIAIKGLLDWLDADPKAPQDRIKSTIDLLLKPYLSGNYNSPSGIYSYSLNSNDISYDVFNPAVFLVGQMQRYSLIAEENRSLIQSEADRIIKIISQHYIKDKNNNLFWNYGMSLQRLERPNDLVHAIYIMEGIREYAKYGGRESTTLDWKLVRDHISAFIQEQRWCEHINRDDCHEKKVRLWAIGMLLYFLATEQDTSPEDISILLKQLDEYQLSNGLFKDEQGFIRHDAHLLLGMSYYLF